MEQAGEVSPWLANLFRLSLVCGLRPGEVRTLTWARVNLPRKKMTVVGKSGEREIHLTEAAVQVLEVDAAGTGLRVRLRRPALRSAHRRRSQNAREGASPGQASSVFGRMICATPLRRAHSPPVPTLGQFKRFWDIAIFGQPKDICTQSEDRKTSGGRVGR